MIGVGQMRTRLVFEEEVKTGVYSELGDPETEWTARFEFWARTRPVKGSESVQSDKPVARREHEIVCRWRPDFGVGGRLRFKGTDRTMQITSIVDWEERRVELTIAATEHVGV